MVMYAVKFIVAAAAAVFAAAATKKDADAVIRGCTSPNKATLVIDGLSRYHILFTQFILTLLFADPPLKPS